MNFHEELNPKLFDKENNEYKLKRAVKSRLVGIAHAFCDFNDIPDSAIKDIRIVGSSCNYNYTPHSDIDLHLVVDGDKIHKDCPIVWNYLYALKTEFNTSHDIKIYGIPVEVYTEPVDQEATSNGIYSLRTGWVKVPELVKPTTNDRAVKVKVRELEEAADFLTKNGDEKSAKEVLDKIYSMRKAGLEKAGEFSTENMAFKELRNKGIVDKLKELVKLDIDKELSLESLQEKEENNMDKINDIICKIISIRQGAKQIHYRNIGYANHLLADRIFEELCEDMIDSFKEQAILSNRELPLTESEYLKRASELIPEPSENDRENWISLWGKVDDLRKEIQGLTTKERAVNALCDDLDSHLATISALLYIETRKTAGLNESDIEHDHKAATETPVDRKEYKAVISEPSEAQKVGLKQSAECAAMCESTLDRVSRKLEKLGE